MDPSGGVRLRHLVGKGALENWLQAAELGYSLGSRYLRILAEARAGTGTRDSWGEISETSSCR